MDDMDDDDEIAALFASPVQMSPPVQLNKLLPAAHRKTHTTNAAATAKGGHNHAVAEPYTKPSRARKRTNASSANRAGVVNTPGAHQAPAKRIKVPKHAQISSFPAAPIHPGVLQQLKPHQVSLAGCSNEGVHVQQLLRCRFLA